MLTDRDPPDTLLDKQISNAFFPVYPKVDFLNARVKVWELRYPPDIRTDVKYLKTDVSETGAVLDKHIRLSDAHYHIWPDENAARIENLKR